MVLSKEKIAVGTYVNVALNNDENKIVKGIIKRIIRSNSEGMIVEMVDGSIGKVKDAAVRRTSYRAVKNIRDRFKKPALWPNSSKKESEKDIFSGESKNVEYKTSALWSQDLSKMELDSRNAFETRQYGNRASKIILAKAIAAFLNTEGGDVIIGIKELKEHGRSNEFVGIENEFSKLKNKDYCEDGYRRMIIDEIIKPYFPKTIFNHFNDYLSISFPKREGKTLCKIHVKKSDHHVFITIDNKDYFFIKVDAETRELYGKQIIDFIKKVFG